MTHGHTANGGWIIAERTAFVLFCVVFIHTTKVTQLPIYDQNQTEFERNPLIIANIIVALCLISHGVPKT